VRSESDANLSCPQDILKGTILQLLALSFRDSAVVLSNDLVGLQHALSKVFQPAQNIIKEYQIMPDMSIQHIIFPAII
jgi:hypothetical protein